MPHGLLVAALRAERLANSGRFSPAEPALPGACSHLSDTLLVSCPSDPLTHKSDGQTAVISMSSWVRRPR